MCCLIYKFLLILTQKMQISFLKILPENALKFVSKKMRICVKNFAQLQKFHKEPVTAQMIQEEIRQVEQTGLKCYKYGFFQGQDLYVKRRTT